MIKFSNEVLEILNTLKSLELKADDVSIIVFILIVIGYNDFISPFILRKRFGVKIDTMLELRILTIFSCLFMIDINYYLFSEFITKNILPLVVVLNLLIYGIYNNLIYLHYSETLNCRDIFSRIWFNLPGGNSFGIGTLLTTSKKCNKRY